MPYDEALDRRAHADNLLSKFHEPGADCNICSDLYTDKVYTDDYDSFVVVSDQRIEPIAKYYAPGETKIEETLHAKYVQQTKVYEREQEAIKDWMASFYGQKSKNDEYVRNLKRTAASARDQISGQINASTENPVKSGGLPASAFASNGVKTEGEDSMPEEDKEVIGTLLTPPVPPPPHKCEPPAVWNDPYRYAYGRERLVPLHSVFMCDECRKQWIVIGQSGMGPSYDKWHHPSWWQLQHWWRILRAQGGGKYKVSAVTKP